MSATTADAAGLPGAIRYTSFSRIGEWFLALLVFLGAFVIVEPAPYELALVVLVVGWVFAGLRIDRYLLPLLVLLLLYVIGGLIGLTLKDELGDPIIYTGTTALLAISAILFAAVIAVDPERRLKVIMTAYVAGATIASILGILGYFGVIPGADLFTLYNRAKGTFQDPNVFGPFLILPFSYLIYQVFTGSTRKPLWSITFALILLLGLFLSFSRAAWGMTAFSMLFVGLMAFINQRSGTARARLIIYFTIAVILGVIAIAFVLTLPGTSDLFAERAQLVQDYDAGAYGRFERHLQGFLYMLERPLGIGPFTFGETFGGDEHNMWLKGFTVYGWLGGFAYIALVIWTLIIAVPLLFKSRPWQPIIICAFGAYLGHLIIHNVIDNDHWRHLFLIYGILWGGYVAEKRLARSNRSQGSAIATSNIFRAQLPRAPAAQGT